MATHLFGIRHHGPGSARSLRAALEALEPDCVLIEGPPDAESLLPLLAHPQMQPPVALLIYDPDQPSRAVYDPFTVYDPEWQAIEYALQRNIPVRFMDLPQTIQIALDIEAETRAMQLASEEEPEAPFSEEIPTELPAVAPETVVAEEVEIPGETSAEETQPEQVRHDPLGRIAEAAGYSDGETWWEHMVEQRRDSADLFQAVLEIMTAVREITPPYPDPEEALREARREAWMRQTIRTAEKEGFQRIAVVCGAWHTPALAERPPAKEDADLLRGLPKTKVAATWIPWTYGRMAKMSGYRAGVTSPAWYEHLWLHPDRVIATWMTRAARLFRAEDLPASPASVIEAVRLAEALASVRDYPIPGLPELWEAARAIFCFGSDLPMKLIQERLIVGERLGHVPDETPMLPIQEDLRNQQSSLRLKPEAKPDTKENTKDLDLRNANDLKRSILLHRLNLLRIPWGTLVRTGGGKGTFHEVWDLDWKPEFEVRLIEANVYGNTVREAASQSVFEQADRLQILAELTDLVLRTLKTELPEAIEFLMIRLDWMTALTSDVPHLMDALPPLAEVLRYGDVRQMDVGIVGHVVDGLIARICIGLPSACSSLNDEAAEAMYPRLMGVHNAVSLLQNETHQVAWNATLERLTDMHSLHGLLAGRCCRLLLDQHIWTAEEVGQRLGLALSAANDPLQAAAWIDGLLRDSGEILVHTDALWPLLDRWVVSLPSELFMELLPLVRRTFSTFPAALRRQLGERAVGVQGSALSPVSTMELDVERAERTLPLLAQLLGFSSPKETSR
ncbi:MAG: hypothetical protein JWN14_2389 [Chthonomonadales bacterium]|nr:hypothetical protein [Chthonomonadales bacterium]